jgi:hypothetical protein
LWIASPTSCVDRVDDTNRKEWDVSSVIGTGASTSAPMPDAFAYHEGIVVNTAEPLRIEVLALHGGPVTLTMVRAVASIDLTPDEARRLGMLLARAAVAARRVRGEPPDTQTAS